MDLQECRRRIRESKSIKDKEQRLTELRDIAEDLANNFTECMSYLEDEISFVLDRTSIKIKEDTGYYSISDVTQDIIVTASWEYSR